VNAESSLELGVMCTGRRHNARGFIVVAVLWILALLSALVLIYLTYVTDTAIVVAGSTDRVQTEALVTAAVELTVYELTGLKEGDRPTHGTYNAKVGITRLSVAFRSEGARIDINTASKDLLMGLIGGLGVEPADAADYADHLIAWRTPMKTSAEDPESLFYRSSGVAYAPRHAAFPGTEELWLVQGIPPPVIERMLPFVTVFSNLASINVADASPEVLAALPGMTPEKLRTVLAERENSAADRKSLTTLAGSDDTPPKAYRLNVNVELSSGRRTGAEVIILLLETGDEPYRVLSWRNGLDGGTGSQKAAL
jgi:general secretion pathway protein K